VSHMRVEDARALKVRKSVVPSQRGTIQDIALRSAVLMTKKPVTTRCPTPPPVLPLQMEDARAHREKKNVAPFRNGTLQDFALPFAVMSTKKLVTMICLTRFPVLLLQMEAAHALKVKKSVVPSPRGTLPDIALLSAVLPTKKLATMKRTTPPPVLLLQMEDAHAPRERKSVARMTTGRDTALPLTSAAPVTKSSAGVKTSNQNPVLLLQMEDAPVLKDKASVALCRNGIILDFVLLCVARN